MKHQYFVDWMKALGMLLIVIGHVVGDPHSLFNSATQPIYAKQLGVTFFVFVMGWGLANEARPGIRVVFNRLFPLYFFGILCALLVSALHFIFNGGLQLSNYLPFTFGINVGLNHFPANPTTWYIGTYLHLILLWVFLLRGREITMVHLAVALVIENICRAALMSRGLDFIAYMVLPNWLTIFLLGMYLHRKSDLGWNPRMLVLSSAWLGMLVAWSYADALLPFDRTIPFRRLPWDQAWVLPMRSLLISLVYVFNTLMFFQIARSLPRLGVVSFFARNTIIIFLSHMPLIFLIVPPFYAWMDTVWLRRLILIVIMFVGPALLSEVIQSIIKVKGVRDWSWKRLCRLFPSLGAVPSSGASP